MASFKSQWIVTAVLATLAVVAVVVWRYSDVNKGTTSSASASASHAVAGQNASASVQVVPSKALSSPGGSFVPVLSSSSISNVSAKAEEGQDASRP